MGVWGDVADVKELRPLVFDSSILISMKLYILYKYHGRNAGVKGILRAQSPGMREIAPTLAKPAQGWGTLRVLVSRASYSPEEWATRPP